jgi:ubiquinone/menaquinone biosynthesis C-methylase UbiE
MSDCDALAHAYDRAMLPLERLILRRQRQRVFPRVRGRILELGAGTGVNLPLYREGARVLALDRSRPMLSLAARRPVQAALALVQADAQRLPFRNQAFGTVSGSLVFCSVRSPEDGLAEARRVLQPAGNLVLIEHMQGRGLGALLTTLVQPLWGVWSRECRLDRRTMDAVERAGFQIRRVRSQVLGIVRTIEARAT